MKSQKKTGKQIILDISTTNAPGEIKTTKILQETSLSTEVNKSTLNLIEKGLIGDRDHASFARTRQIELIKHRKKRVFRLMNSAFQSPESESKAETSTTSNKKATPQESNLSISLDRSRLKLAEIEVPNGTNSSCLAHDQKVGIIHKYRNRPLKLKHGRFSIPEAEFNTEAVTNIGFNNRRISQETNLSLDLNRSSLSFGEKEMLETTVEKQSAKARKFKLAIIKKKQKRPFTLKGKEFSIPKAKKKDLNSEEGAEKF